LYFAGANVTINGNETIGKWANQPCDSADEWVDRAIVFGR
jgi:hypothetical protein